MKNSQDYTSGSSLWQEFEYRKRLKNLIESGLSVAEIETRSQQIYKELKNENLQSTN